MDDAPQIISLSLVRERDRQARCAHGHLEVDEALSTVLCLDCGLHLNPISVLAKYARREILLGNKVETYRAVLEELKKKNRVQCQHCKRYTPINKHLGIDIQSC